MYKEKKNKPKLTIMHNYVTPDILNYHTYLYCRSIQLKLNCECDGQKMHFFPTPNIPETTSTRIEK